MTFADLLKSVTWPDLKAALLWSHTDVASSLGAYQSVLAKLKQHQPVTSGMRIIVTEAFRREIDDEAFIEVIGRNGERNRDQGDFQYFQDKVDDGYANAEVDFSISFQPWEEWLGMEVDKSTLDQFPAPEIAAHCILDMTFHGFEQSEVQETLDEIKRRADEVDAMTAEEKEELLIPAYEVMKRLKPKYDER